ncbi:FtsX-like permease family protein [Candidatus Amarolinea aalborgensis]|uniref:FtsX-like permease family protein n=1 Tax=Candidatus Amarolinea aalborgensis TaxID=2249329 RepID=UPI003BF95511
MRIKFSAPRYLLRVSLRHVARRRWQSVLFIMGVALGVAMMVAIDLANGSASRAFRLSTETVAGKATHQVFGGPAGLDESVYRRARVDLHQRNSAPVVEGYVSVPTLDNQPLRLLGVDPFAEAPFRSYLTSQSDRVPLDSLTALLTRPNTVLLSESLAQRFGLQRNDTLSLRVGAQTTTVQVVGLIRAADDISRRGLDGLILTDIATAQELLDMRGRLSHIDLIIPAGDTATLDQIRAILPLGATIEAAAARAGVLEQMTSAFELNLTALSLLALVVGMFLIYNTVSFSVIQRRPVLGTLRALGMTRREIFAIVLFEAAALGLIGSLLGLALGVILGRAAVTLVTQTITDLYFVVNVRSVDVPFFSLLKGLVIGLSAALLAAAAPALEATNVPPVNAFRRSVIESQIRRYLPSLTLAGVGLIGLSVLLLWLPQNSLVLNFAGLFMLVLAFALLTPGVTLALMTVVTPLTSRLFGYLGRLAPRTISRSLSRTSVAIAALMVSVSVIIGVSLMIGSFRSTVEDWLAATLQADIFISPPSLTATRVTTALPDGLATALAREPELRRVETARSVTVSSPDLGSVAVVAATGDVSDGHRRYLWSAAPDAAALWQQVRQGAVIVSEPFVNLRKLPNQGRGATLRLLSDHGLAEFPVAGVYYDYAAGAGTVIMDDAVYRRLWNDRAVTSIAIYVQPGRDVDAVVETLRSRFAGEEALVINPNAGLRRAVLDVFDRAFAITIALQLLATVVAFIGVLSALLSLQLERTRELGILAASGLTRRQLWGLTLLETGLMGGTAGLLALPAGLALALVLIYVINLRSFGWTLLLQVSPAAFLQALGVALLAALLAGIYPAWRQARIVIADALRGE